MERNIKLPQSWVTRVTSDALTDDIFTVGHDVDEVPSDEAILSVVSKAATTTAVREMIRRKWFLPEPSEDKQLSRGKGLRDFLFGPNSHRALFAVSARYRRQIRQRDLVDELAASAWLCRVMDRAMERPSSNFEADRLNDKAITRLVRLSNVSSGPVRAIGYLAKLGVTVVLENALPGMRTDGASFIAKGVGPVIAMTLRHDRIDSFWFTLLHEIGHVLLHLTERPNEVFVDSLEEDETDEFELEAEANAFAKDAFVPRDTWLRSDAFRFCTESAVLELAGKCSIHPAIVAGRLRFEKRKFTALTHLLGTGEVRSVLMAG
ncbi:MAG: ImmA/IrrE family metallo-endopeptidase [Bryobacteraceae bacterium]